MKIFFHVISKGGRKTILGSFFGSSCCILRSIKRTLFATVVIPPTPLKIFGVSFSSLIKNPIINMSSAGVSQLSVETETKSEETERAEKEIPDNVENIETCSQKGGATSDAVEEANTDEKQALPENVSGNSNKKFFRRKPKKRKAKQLHQTFKKARLSSDEVLSQTKYYFENGLRKVVPYDHQFNTFCKGRWVGKTLEEIYTKEFRLYPVQYYQRAVQAGRLLINLEKPESLHTIVQDNDLLTSVVHRHECPVTDDPIEVIVDDENFFVVNKPSSIPLHPAGRFRHNTLLSILAKEHGKKSILSLHRLDRMTSGLLLFAKNRETAKKLHAHIRDRKVEKEYVCRVVGDFTKFKIDDEGDFRVKVEGDTVTVSEPVMVYDRRIGTSIVSRDKDAKDCETSFRCLSTDGKTSVVCCKPKTGRTHQIRVHLQFLGYPITNDLIYNDPAWGDERLKLGPITKPFDQVIEGLSRLKKWATVLESFNETIERENLEKPSDGNEESMRENGKEQSEQEVKCNTAENNDLDNQPKSSENKEGTIKTIDGIVSFRPDCEECKNPLPDPTPSELVMYLHALRYKGPDWGFETPLPKWAKEDWTEGDQNQT